MSKLIRGVFPMALAVAWLITAGYALSRLASLHDTVAQRWAIAQPAEGGARAAAAGRLS